MRLTRMSRRMTVGLSAALLAAITVGAASMATAATTGTAATAAPAANAAGFIYGSDSWPVPITGPAPWPMTHLTGSYGGYIGMAGNWARSEGCSTGNFLAY